MRQRGMQDQRRMLETRSHRADRSIRYLGRSWIQRSSENDQGHALSKDPTRVGSFFISLRIIRLILSNLIIASDLLIL